MQVCLCVLGSGSHAALQELAVPEFSPLHTSGDEILQLLMTCRGENTSTKSRGLFSTSASTFKHLQTVNKVTDLAQIRHVKSGSEFCVSVPLQLFLLYDITKHQGREPAGSTVPEEPSCVTPSTALFGSLCQPAISCFSIPFGHTVSQWDLCKAHSSCP